MAEHRSLWEEMFYPGAEEENLLAWGLYMLARQGGPEALPPETLRRRLMAFLLTRELDELAEIRDLAGLTAFLNGQTCGVRTKWICLQIWQDPLVYWGRYCPDGGPGGGGLRRPPGGSAAPGGPGAPVAQPAAGRPTAASCGTSWRWSRERTRWW